MLELVKKAASNNHPVTYTAQYINLRKKEKYTKPEIRIRPRSLLCTASSEEAYGRNVCNQSNTWKFHRPRPNSIRYRPLKRHRSARFAHLVAPDEDVYWAIKLTKRRCERNFSARKSCTSEMSPLRFLRSNNNNWVSSVSMYA